MHNQCWVIITKRHVEGSDILSNWELSLAYVFHVWASEGFEVNLPAADRKEATANNASLKVHQQKLTWLHFHYGMHSQHSWNVERYWNIMLLLELSWLNFSKTDSKADHNQAQNWPHNHKPLLYYVEDSPKRMAFSYHCRWLRWIFAALECRNNTGGGLAQTFCNCHTEHAHIVLADMQFMYMYSSFDYNCPVMEGWHPVGSGTL